MQLNENVKDKILGMIFGQALGDSYGLSVEFLTREDIEEEYYPDEVIPFYNYILNHHNIRWPRGDWTDDTDQFICIMDSFSTLKQVDIFDIASRFVDWMRGGLKECGDNCGMGIGKTTYNVFSHPDYLENPHKVTLYEYRKNKIASNGALMRTAIVGAIDFINEKNVTQNTINIAKLTHFNPKTVIGTVYMTTILAAIFNACEKGHEINLESIKEETYIKCLSIYDDIADEVNKSSNVINLKTKLKEKADFSQAVITNDDMLTEILFDTEPFVGDAFINLSAFCYGLNTDLKEMSSDEFKSKLHYLIRQGGDADTNGAVCGAILGARLGFKNLPQDWINLLPFKDLLFDKANNFLKALIKA